jgi:hypothetical protein
VPTDPARLSIYLYSRADETSSRSRIYRECRLRRVWRTSQIPAMQYGADYAHPPVVVET